MKTVRSILMATVAALLGLAIVSQGTPTTGSDFRAVPQNGKIPCKCCAKAAPASASFPACCTAAPVGQRAPLAPASVPTRGLNERLALPMMIALIANVSRPASPETFISTRGNSIFFSSPAVPIFQRNCSYLI